MDPCSSDGDDRLYLEELVEKSLIHLQLWKDVVVEDKLVVWKGVPVRLLTGCPPHVLSHDEKPADGIGREYILPVNMTQYKEEQVTLAFLDIVFSELCAKDTKRIILAIVNTDGTVVFYFVYNGVHKPKRN
ncbi:Sen15p KNAG_0H00380 [Huiozyma naganishii CBS 8797]|uniref:tRNA-splicing endonuclease subunit Sen15 domain-containing protein n=1 Tax=Huiozyma naganishii (strain ATCC MYA-139 / BCRC 22969 / CBS 8797 / KCTC 17520 / NBRC 10181 / NCYC 3082 / Yp74L-3) TaxID=1071383 RepID=J7S8A9_HUIN7|nr:hypothetical protein KNAG_0H00380 [Kazachstania naganishii CBS 8797]CCK71454.1 hypothetical protein KNAG_0H00380 [Kazachstania naganishii CBS 8797]